MSNEYKISSGCERCGTDATKARIEQLEAEIHKLINLIEGQRKDIDLMKGRMATIKALAMDEVGTRRAK